MSSQAKEEYFEVLFKCHKEAGHPAFTGTLLHKQIPINTNQWDESRPGFFKADTVAHCGDLFCVCLPTPLISPILLRDGRKKAAGVKEKKAFGIE